MGAISKLSEKCKLCANVDKCHHKKMELCAYFEPTISANLSDCAPLSVVKEMVVKHNYRDIKIGENTTVTIDLEELKRQIEEDFYRQVRLGCFF